MINEVIRASGNTDSITFESHFKLSAEKLSSILRTAGVYRRPYSDSTLPHFSSLEENLKKNALELLNFYNTSLEQVLSSGEIISNDSVALWSAFKLLKLKPPSDFLSYLTQGDCIEIYDLNHIQIWRNLNSMEVISHTIEQIFCVPWPARYIRDPQAFEECIEKIGAALRQEKAAVFQANINNYLLEKGSLELFKLNCVHKLIAPLTDSSGRIAAYAVVSAVDIVGRQEPVLGSFPTLSLVQ